MTPNGRAAITDDAITVTTATRSEDEVRASLVPADAKKVETPAGTVVPGADDVAKKAAADLAAQEADSDKPDAALSEAGRTLRLSRGDARKKKITEEINEHVSRREKAREEADREEARLAALKKPAPPPAEHKPAADAAKPNADGKASAAPEFKFPTFDQWQVDHPDGDWVQYGDERQDARNAFRDEQRQVTERAHAEERERTEAFSRADEHQKAYRATHPDYDEKLSSINTAKYGVVVENGVVVQAPHQFIGLQRLLLRAGAAGPGILVYLADHPEDMDRLMDRQTTPGDLLEMFGEIKYAAKASATATPTPAAAAAAAGEKPAAPAAEPVVKPRTSAPAPLTVVPGSSSVSKTPQQLSEESGEDADSYIAVREPGILKRAQRR